MTIIKHKIEMPELYILILAVHGNMGQGDIPDLMQHWAQRTCRELGIEKRMIEMQDEKLAKLERRLRNTLGDRMTNQIQEMIDDTMKKIVDA